MKGLTKEKARRMVITAYISILNRKPEKGGLNLYVNKLISDDEFDEVDLLYNLYTSKEYCNKNSIK